MKGGKLSERSERQRQRGCTNLAPLDLLTTLPDCGSQTTLLLFLTAKDTRRANSLLLAYEEK